MSTAKVIQFPIERVVRAKALRIGDVHSSNLATDSQPSSERRCAVRLRSVKRTAARALAAQLFDDAVGQSELLHVEVAACLDVDLKTERRIRDGELPLEVGHLLLLPEAAALRALDIVRASILARRR